MKINTILFLLIFSVYNNLYAQKLYFVVEDNNLVKKNPIQRDFSDQNQLAEAIVFYQDDFVTHDLQQDYKKSLLEKSIAEKIPNKYSTGVAILDWEGEKAKILRGSNFNKRIFQETLDEFLRCLRDAKRLRPNMKWSFYGFPVRIANNHPYNTWTIKMERLKPLYREMDFICPNLYMFKRADKAKYIQDINKQLTFSLKMGKEFGKPVLPLIWNRYQTDSDLIPLLEFSNHINRIKNATFLGKTINGIIWWNSEGFNYIRRARYPKIRQEYLKVKDRRYYQMTLLNSYLNAIHKNNIR